MTAPDTASEIRAIDGTGTTKADTPALTWREGLAVYLQPRVLIVLFLGFASGLPLALSGSTLQIWMRELGVDLGT
ncbi:MAG: MFS transporter, partial [Tardiphaga sp.]